MASEIELRQPAPVEPAEPRRGRGLAARAGSAVVVVLFVLGKASVYSWVLRHPASAGVAFAAGAGVALLKGRPRGAALSLAVAIPCLIAPGWAAGIGIGVAAYVLLIALFTAIGTLLMWQDHRAAG